MAFVYKVKKGDTLNKISQNYGFANYKAAGINSVPSGNFDLIREGEEINLGNYDPNAIKTLQQGSPVVSSKDNEQQFRDDSDKISGIDTAFSDSVLGKTKTETKTTEQTPFATGEKKDAAGEVQTTGDPLLDKLNKWEKDQAAQFEVEATTRKKEYENLYTTSLAAVDATTQATIDRINTSYDKRTDEQRRINQLNIDRVKAYGLGNGGQYTPIAFRDAISLREQEASDKISELDNQRNSLIAQAKSARDAGASGLLRDKLDDLEKVESSMRAQLEDVEREAESQYKLLRDLRKEEETKHAAQVTKMKERLAALAPQYAGDYEGMSPEERDAFITKLAQQTGLDYATVYSTLETSIMTATKDKLDIKKKESDIQASNALTGARNASAAKSWADAAVVNTDKKNQSAMQGDVPDTFTSAAEAETKRKAFVKKYGEKGKEYWDNIFYNKEDEEYSYDIGGEGGSADDPLGILGE